LGRLLEQIERTEVVNQTTGKSLMSYRNRPELRLVLFGLVSAASLAVSPVMAGSQSSNSSSNCSNGRCSRVDTLVIEDGRGRSRGWQRVERWDERRGRGVRRPYHDRGD
jgi:hypothetical protein